MRPSSIDSSGKRNKIILADVAGKFQKWKNVVFIILIAIYAIVPFIKIGGHPLIFIDIEHRRFFLFGETFNSQDFYLIFFVITGIIFGLFYLTALFGRVWCGWACPQTVFLEGVFRKIERWVDGPAQKQRLLLKEKINAQKLLKRIAKHALYIVAGLAVSHIFISYFVSMEQLFQWVQGSPQDHIVAFGWMAAITLIIYINFAWFREQLCLIVCPYGRFQSVLIDDDSFIIGYDEKRGEPRGKKSDEGRGDCIDCHRCVQVCPTGIDIREGLQLECVGCANCIDACDDIMDKLGQKHGLIRYDSYNGLHSKKRRIIRPRIIFYTILMLIGAVVATTAFLSREPFEANLLRSRGVAPYVIEGEKIRNQFMLHLFNKTPERTTFSIKFEGIKESDEVIIPLKKFNLLSLESKKIPIFIKRLKSEYRPKEEIKAILTNISNGDVVEAVVPFIGP